MYQRLSGHEDATRSPDRQIVTSVIVLISQTLIVLGMLLLVPKAELIGTCMEMLGYGTYLIIFIECVRVLYTKYAHEKGGLYLSAVTLVIFVLVTSHLVIDLVRVTAAFADDMGTPNGPTTYYNTISQLGVTTIALYCTVAIVADALIVYRLFAVWGYNHYIVIVPLLLFFAEIGVSVLWLARLIHGAISHINDSKAVTAGPARIFFTLTLILNVLCICGIFYKIWVVKRGINSYAAGSASRLRRVLSVMAESFIIYAAWAIALILANVLSIPVLYLFLNSICPIIGMACSAVVIRVLKDRSARTTKSTFTAGDVKVPIKICEKCSREDAFARNVRTVATHVHPGGVQITLDTIKHSDKDASDYAMEKLESQTSGLYRSIDNLV